MKNKIIFILISVALIGIASCTNRQMFDRWQARGIKKHWLDTATVKKVEKLLDQDSVDFKKDIDSSIEKIIDSAFKAKDNPKIYYVNNDTCMNKQGVSELVKDNVVRVIERRIYESIRYDDGMLKLRISYDRNGKRIISYEINKPTVIVPPHTPTFWEKVVSFLKKLGWYIGLILLLLIILAFIALRVMGKL